MLRDPIDDSLRRVGPACGRTFAQKAVALLGVQHQFGGRIAGAHEAHKQLFGLALGAAFVLGISNDKGHT